MKFFLLISLLTGISLGTTVELGLKSSPKPSIKLPGFLTSYQRKIKDSFDRPENANLLFTFLTGSKNGISPHTKKAFKKVNLSFLLSPSGIHFSSLFMLIAFFLKRLKNKGLKHLTKSGLLISIFSFTSIDSLKRLIIMRLLFQFKFLSKIKFSTEHIFFLTFLTAFIMGQFSNSPLGFIFSFAFLGTFFALRNYSKVILILGLFSTQLILGLFMGNKISLISIPCGLFGSFVFTLLFPFCILFFLSFWAIEINWIEPLIKGYVASIKLISKYLTGSFTSPSVFLIVAIWVLMFHPHGRRKYILLFILIFCHTNTAMTPVIFS